jgi:hypothetical protein
MNVDNFDPGLVLIESMRLSRDKVVVAKTDILVLRSKIPNVRIFVFEGDDDKVIYHSWISRVSANLRYEPFCCNGKTKVLALRDSLASDKANSVEGIYFFVDRDFDDLQGRHLDDRTFMTSCYSVENYLARDEVLDVVLTNDFHLNGLPEERTRIIALYNELFDDFLDLAKHANERIYVARKAKVELLKQLPSDCKKIAKIYVDRIDPTSIDPDTWLTYKSAVAQHEIDLHLEEFQKLDPRARYRGKFILDFFKRWLEMLCEDARSEHPIVLIRRAGVGRIKVSEFTLGSFAIKSCLPEGLHEFVASSHSP